MASSLDMETPSAVDMDWPEAIAQWMDTPGLHNDTDFWARASLDDVAHLAGCVFSQPEKSRVLMQICNHAATNAAHLGVWWALGQYPDKDQRAHESSLVLAMYLAQHAQDSAEQTAAFVVQHYPRGEKLLPSCVRVLHEHHRWTEAAQVCLQLSPLSNGASLDFYCSVLGRDYPVAWKNFVRDQCGTGAECIEEWKSLWAHDGLLVYADNLRGRKDMSRWVWEAPYSTLHCALSAWSDLSHTQEDFTSLSNALIDVVAEHTQDFLTHATLFNILNELAKMPAPTCTLALESMVETMLVSPHLCNASYLHGNLVEFLLDVLPCDAGNHRLDTAHIYNAAQKETQTSCGLSFSQASTLLRVVADIPNGAAQIATAMAQCMEERNFGRAEWLVQALPTSMVDAHMQQALTNMLSDHPHLHAACGRAFLHLATENAPQNGGNTDSSATRRGKKM